MALLDRLRPQPGWKHADPAVRLSAVESIDAADQALLATIAREDDAPRVRRAAVARLQDVDALAAVARNDSDEQTRTDAAERLTAIASAPPDGSAEIGLRAVAALASERALANVAKSAAPIDVANAAAARLQEPKSHGSVARHAEHESIRLAALGRLNDAAELEAVATRTDHKDVGLAALDRLLASSPTEATLDGIAVRAKNKVVARRARAVVKERALAETAARAAADTLARKRALLCEAAETLDRTLERTRDAVRITNELTRLTDEWDKLPPADAEAAGRWERAMERVRMHVEDLARQETQDAERRAAWDEAISRRRTLIDAVGAITEEPATERLAELRAEWTALEASDSPDIAGLDRDFSRACDAVTDRATARERATAAHQRLAALAAEVGTLADAEDRDTVRSRWQAATAEWRDLTHGLPIDAALHAQYSNAVTRWRERDQAARDAAARQASENQTRLQELHDRATALGAAADAPMKDLDRLSRDLRGALDAPGALAEGGDDLVARLRVLHGALGTRLRELRETDEWRRWANAGIQEELCKRIEGLRDVADLSEVSRQLRDLRRQWKAVSAAPKDEADALWVRFKTAADEAQARADTHFATVAAEQTENLTRKQALCDQAETLAQSTDWIATAETLKKLQADWQTIGAVPKEQAPELARRFRVACDTFFTRRKTDLAQRKDEWSTNQKKKEELCVKMEQLAESSDWNNTFNEIKKLQGDWKTVGAVRRNKSEALWKRFRGACDKFFERYGKRHELDLGKKLEEREEVCRTLEAMVPPPEETAPTTDELVRAVEELWGRWRSAPGVPPQQLVPIRARFESAVTSVFAAYPEQFKGTIFDAQQTVKRMTQLCDDVENVTKGIVPAPQLGGATSAAVLASMLKEKLAANTIGGRVNEEAKARAAFERIRHAQQTWRELGPVLGQEGQQLESRFQKACRRFFEQHPQFEQQQRPQHGGGGGGRDRDRGRPHHHGGGARPANSGR